MSQGEQFVKRAFPAAGSSEPENPLLKEVTGVLAYTPLASISNAIDVVRDLPPLEYCVPRPGLLLENSSDEDLEAIISAVDDNAIEELVNAAQSVDMRKLRFLSIPNSGDPSLNEHDVELPKPWNNLQLADRFLETAEFTAAELAVSREELGFVLEARRNPLSFLESRIRSKFGGGDTEETVPEVAAQEIASSSRESQECFKNWRTPSGGAQESFSEIPESPSSAAAPGKRPSSPRARNASFPWSPLQTSALASASLSPSASHRSADVPTTLRRTSRRLSALSNSSVAADREGGVSVPTTMIHSPTPVKRDLPRLSQFSLQGPATADDAVTYASHAAPLLDTVPPYKRRKLSATIAIPVMSLYEASSGPETPKNCKSRLQIEDLVEKQKGRLEGSVKPVIEYPMENPMAQVSSGRKPSTSSRGSISSAGSGAVRKLNDALCELFAAEDNNNADYTLRERSFGLSESHPHSVPKNLLRKIVGLVNKCASAGKLGQVEEDKIARLMKLLELEVRAVETLDLAFCINGTEISASSHAKLKTKRSSRMPVVEGEGAGENGESSETETSGFAEQVKEGIEKILTGFEAATLVLTLLSKTGLPKYFYSEDLIGACINFGRNHLANTVIPALRASAVGDYDQFSMKDVQILQLRRLLRHSELKRSLTAIMPLLASTLFQRLFDLMQSTWLSDNLVVSVGYASVMPFFVDMRTTNSKASGGLAEDKALDGIRLACLGLLRTIFAHHPAQRNWILEEILTSLLKLPSMRRNFRHYRLPDGKDIQMVSALLLQLLQSCATGAVADAMVLASSVDLANPLAHVSAAIATPSKRGKRRSRDKVMDQNGLSDRPETASSLKMINNVLKIGN